MVTYQYKYNVLFYLRILFKAPEKKTITDIPVAKTSKQQRFDIKSPNHNCYLPSPLYEIIKACRTKTSKGRANDDDDAVEV